MEVVVHGWWLWCIHNKIHIFKNRHLCGSGAICELMVKPVESCSSGKLFPG